MTKQSTFNPDEVFPIWQSAKGKEILAKAPTEISIPPQFAGRTLEDLTLDDLLEVIELSPTSGIRISFSGKANARGLGRAVRPRVTTVVAKYGVGTPEERAVNRVIEGDNLQAMATLYRERGQVDLIVTDPPYNTGRDFRYNDRWEEDPNDPGMGEFVSDDDGAKHTKWMRFMWPRLQMMKSMLKPGGVLAICIDHRELFRLGQMLDELFDERNRLAIINWEKSYAPKNDSKHISTATEYVLVYAREIDKVKTELLDRTQSMDARYGNPDGDPKGLWQSDNSGAAGADTHPGMVYGIQNPFTGEILYPPESAHWRSERSKIKAWLEEWGGLFESRDLDDGAPTSALVIKGIPVPTPADHPLLLKAQKHAVKVRDTKVWPQLFFLKDGIGRPRLKRYLEQVKKGIVPMTYWASDDFLFPEELGSISWEHEQSGHSQSGINELDAIVGKGHGFETVKPMKLISKIIQLWCPSDGVVMDPFAGSGTTGHAVLELNQIAEANRRFVLVEQGRPENGDSYARTLLANRLRRVITGDWSVGKRAPLGSGFTFITLGKKVDAPVLLQMERDELVDTVISSHFDASRQLGDQLIRIEDKKKPYRYLVGRNADNEGFFLVWDGPGTNTDFTEDVYEACAAEAASANLKTAPYNVYARLYLYQTEGVRFLQIPDRILADFGLNVRSEPFTEKEDE
jgi:adenine-specific DNA-methyltransferase